MERTRFWRRMGRLLNTRAGAEMLRATGGLVNRVAAATMAFRPAGAIPWTPLARPLAECRVALISTAGFHLPDQPPFDVDSRAGDPSFREFPSSIDPRTLRIAHAHYPHRYADADPNVLLPLDRLRELAGAGVFRLAPRVFSFGFGGTLTRAYVQAPDGTAHQLARKLREDGVDAALLVPG